MCKACMSKYGELAIVVHRPKLKSTQAVFDSFGDSTTGVVQIQPSPSGKRRAKVFHFSRRLTLALTNRPSSSRMVKLVPPVSAKRKTQF